MVGKSSKREKAHMLDKKLSTVGTTRASPSLAKRGSSSRVRTRSNCDLTKRTAALVRGLRLVIAHHRGGKHGFYDIVIAAMDSQVHAYLDNASSEKIWLARAKHMLAYPLSDYLRNERPKAPDVVFQPEGVFKKWWNNRIRVFNRKNTHLWYSWLQAKRCALPASEEFIRSTYDEHYAKLSKEDQGNKNVIAAIMRDDTFMKVLEKTRRAVASCYNKNDPYTSGRTSVSACFERTRSQGGQHEELRKLAGMEECQFGDELVSMKFYPVLYGRKNRYNQVIETRRVTGSEFWNYGLQEEYINYHGNAIKCTIQAVLEPMKVRVISKGEALPYYIARPIQQAMHSTLREMPCFRLIGRPLCPTDVCDLAKRALRTYSGGIFEYIIQDLPLFEQMNALQVLGPHALHYPSERGSDVVFRGLQRNGQLMGSILSFPILCLANLGVYLYVTRYHQKGWTHKERLDHVLVNGDDMVYAADPLLWEDHVETAKEVGLEMSVGKAYLHGTYLNVNSTSIHYDLSKEKETPWQIDFLNAGLFFGNRKVQGKTDKGSTNVSVEYEDMISRYNNTAKAHLSADPTAGFVCNIGALMKGCLPGKQCSLLKQYIHLNQDEILKETLYKFKRSRGGEYIIRRNIFLPVTAGGMGVEAPAGWRFKTTMTDREVAYELRKAVDLPMQPSPACSNAVVVRGSRCYYPELIGKDYVLPAYTLNSVVYDRVPWVKLTDKEQNVIEWTVDRHGHNRLHPNVMKTPSYWCSPNQSGCAIL